MKKLLFGLIATVMLAITVNAQGTLRAEFLKGKTQDEIIKSFNELTTEQKNSLWMEKLDQLLSQKLPDSYLSSIKIMKNSQEKLDLASFKKEALNIVKTTPKEDFILMFYNLNDYNFTGKFLGNTSISDDVILDINNYGTSQEVTDPNSRLRLCNCNWSCDFYAGGNRGNCKKTVDGCGFFGMSECTGYVGPRG